ISLPPLQRQQDRSRPVRFAALLRFRQGAQGGPFRSISRELRFSWHACLHSPHPRQTILSIAHSRAVCLDRYLAEIVPQKKGTKQAAGIIRAWQQTPMA